MTESAVFGHPDVERRMGDEYDASLWYECQKCGLRGTELQEFEQYSCGAEHPQPDPAEGDLARAEAEAERKAERRYARHVDRHGYF